LRAATMARELIVRRTRSGYDWFGRPFAPYRPRTIERKRRKGQPTSPVRMTDTGQMLDRLQVRPGRQSSGQLGLRQSAEIVPGTARDERLIRIRLSGAPGRHRARRDFWGLTQREARLVDATCRQSLARVVPPDLRRRVKIRVF